jgi:hypothetical protein
MRKTTITGLLMALLTVGSLQADETANTLQVQTASSTDQLALSEVRSIAYEGETSMLIHLADTTLTYPIADVQLISFTNTGVTALVHVTDRSAAQNGVVRLYGVGGRLLHQYPSLQQLQQDLLQRPAGIYLIETDGQTSKLLKP